MVKFPSFIILITLLSACGDPQKTTISEPNDVAIDTQSHIPDTGNHSPDMQKHDDGGVNTEEMGIEIDMHNDVSEPDMPATSTCKVTLCLTGAIKPDESWNAAFEDLCDRPGIVESVVQYCRKGGECFSSWNNFWSGPNLRKKIFPKLIEKLDTNGDGRVDDTDTACDLHLVGYSWGGINSAKMADLIKESDLFSENRKKIHKMVTLDPYQRGITVPKDFLVPSNVEKFWTFRHSEKKNNDCSSGSIGGPYFGIQPICTASSVCKDYNYTGDQRVFSWPATPGSPAGSAVGDDLGHCNVMRASAEAAYTVLMNLPLPDPVPVPVDVPVK